MCSKQNYRKKACNVKINTILSWATGSFLKNTVIRSGVSQPVLNSGHICGTSLSKWPSVLGFSIKRQAFLTLIATHFQSCACLPERSALNPLRKSIESGQLSTTDKFNTGNLVSPSFSRLLSAMTVMPKAKTDLKAKCTGALRGKGKFSKKSYFLRWKVCSVENMLSSFQISTSQKFGHTCSFFTIIIFYS